MLREVCQNTKVKTACKSGQPFLILASTNLRQTDKPTAKKNKIIALSSINIFHVQTAMSYSFLLYMHIDIWNSPCNINHNSIVIFCQQINETINWWLQRPICFLTSRHLYARAAVRQVMFIKHDEMVVKGFCLVLNKNQLHTVSSTQQVRQRKPSVKTLGRVFPTFHRRSYCHCMH